LCFVCALMAPKRIAEDRIVADGAKDGSHGDMSQRPSRYLAQSWMIIVLTILPQRLPSSRNLLTLALVVLKPYRLRRTVFRLLRCVTTRRPRRRLLTAWLRLDVSLRRPTARAASEPIGRKIHQGGPSGSEIRTRSYGSGIQRTAWRASDSDTGRPGLSFTVELRKCETRMPERLSEIGPTGKGADMQVSPVGGRAGTGGPWRLRVRLKRTSPG
jgi:hypothetical protein